MGAAQATRSADVLREGPGLLARKPDFPAALLGAALLVLGEMLRAQIARRHAKKLDSAD